MHIYIYIYRYAPLNQLTGLLVPPLGIAGLRPGEQLLCCFGGLLRESFESFYSRTTQRSYLLWGWEES